jgi:hypothetical protein
MPYIFTPAAPDSPVARFTDMKDFRGAFAPLVLTIKGSKVTLDGAAFGTLSYTKKGPERPADVSGINGAVQPSDERPSLADVLADIDRLEAEDTPMHPDDVALLEDMDGDGSDFEDDAPMPRVDAPRTGAQGPAARAGIPMGDNPDEGRRSAPRTPISPRESRRAGTRMSHKNCGHAISGQAGKEARALCRAERARLAAEAV